MANKKLWTPRPYSESYNQHGSTSDRPTSSKRMFYNHHLSYPAAFTDHESGNTINFGQTLGSSDNKMTDLNEVWASPSSAGHAETTGDHARRHYLSFHIGYNTDRYSISDIQRGTQHMLPGYIGLRFQYRWPTPDARNYWSVSPISINDLALHYYNASARQVWSYATTCAWASPSNKDYWPDRFASNSSRKSDSWKGCVWKPNTAAINQIKNNQLFLIGASFEMKYHDQNKAMSKPDCMDIRNMTPVWDAPSGHTYRPVLAKERNNNWSGAATHELYMV